MLCSKNVSQILAVMAWDPFGRKPGWGPIAVPIGFTTLLHIKSWPLSIHRLLRTRIVSYHRSAWSEVDGHSGPQQIRAVTINFPLWTAFIFCFPLHTFNHEALYLEFLLLLAHHKRTSLIWRGRLWSQLPLSGSWSEPELDKTNTKCLDAQKFFIKSTGLDFLNTYNGKVFFNLYFFYSY